MGERIGWGREERERERERERGGKGGLERTFVREQHGAAVDEFGELVHLHQHTYKGEGRDPVEKESYLGLEVGAS